MSSLVVSGLSIDVRGPTGDVRAVDDVSFTLDRGDLVALVGESGSGKTLTARAVLGLLPDGATQVGGSVRWNARDLDRVTAEDRRRIRGAEIAYVPQEPALDPVMRIGRQLVESMRAHGSSTGDVTARVVGLLESVGIPDPERRARAYPHELSGGMRQRVTLALALANEPDLIVADEPTTALDVITQARVLDLLTRARSGGDGTLLFVTHDLGIVAGIADRVLVMYAGRIVEEASVEDIFASPRHPYTAALVGAVPRADDPTGALRTIPGTTPTPGSWPPGCAYHPRCRHADPACLVLVPPLEPTADGGGVACIRTDVLGPLDPRREGVLPGTEPGPTTDPTPGPTPGTATVTELPR